MASITNRVEYESDTGLGKVKVVFTRMKRVHMQKVFAVIDAKVNEEGSVVFEIPLQKMNDVTDIIAEFLPQYVTSVWSDIEWDGNVITTIEPIIEESIFYGMLVEMCMKLFRDSAVLTEEQGKNSERGSLPDSTVSDQTLVESVAPSVESE